jgi:hypothetical protein
MNKKLIAAAFAGASAVGLLAPAPVAHAYMHCDQVPGAAKECYRTWLKFRHLGAAKKKAEEQERQEADRRLRALLRERRG